MARGTHITIDVDAFVGKLHETRRQVAAPKGLMSAILGAAQRVCQDHFLLLNQARNRYGSNFYAQYAENDRYLPTVTDNGTHGTLSIVDESGALRHKISGGNITPKRAKALAIPVSEIARRTRVSPAHGTIPGLFIVKSKTGKGAFLATNENNRLVVHYLLRKSVTHRPRPEVMPSEQDLATAAQSACRTFFLSLQK